MQVKKLASRTYFPVHVVAIAVLFLLLGVRALFDDNRAGLIVGPIFLITGSLIGLTAKVSLLDSARKRFRNTASFLGIPMGKWQSLEGYACVCVLEIHLRHESGSWTLSSAFNSPEYRVTLLSEDHRVKTTICELKEKEAAFDLAEEISADTGLPVVTYNPPVSRRRRHAGSREL